MDNNMKYLQAFCTSLLFASLANFSSAATIKDCASVNWYEQGQLDAAKELPIEQVEKYNKPCASQHITPNKKDYIDGYNFNLQGMCTFDKGLNEGQKNLKALKICPLDSAYLDGYEKGQMFYHENNRLNTEALKQIKDAEGVKRSGGDSYPRER